MRALLMFVLIGLSLPALGAAPRVPAQAKPDETAKLLATIAELERENEALRNENRILRGLIKPLPAPQAVQQAATAGAGQPKASGPTQTNAPQSAVSGETDTDIATCWMSPDGMRHNSKCRLYMKGGGRFCKPKTGVPCPACGG